ncbi:vWA domain-containing protein [Thiolinea disciformis]|uniref:vWA domain-containing protein n=1 Tax=Thiolinea disciformis TaxID=125614 RepID=UPI000382D11A|nr:VWA-like domain-containing protein [Thiolinea disciformis]
MTENLLSPQEINDKLVAVRTRLILDRPFLGALVLRLPLQPADPAWCATTGTDARKFYYNPDYIAELRPEELQFVMAHEALHCALGHFARRQHRVKHRWDLACDYAINPILMEEGLKPPPSVMVMREFKGMTAEEIYPCIDDNDLSETLDQHLYDKEDTPKQGGQDQEHNPLNQQNANPTDGDGESSERSDPQPQSAKTSPSTKPEFDPEAQGGTPPPPPLQQNEAEDLAVQWQQRAAGAAQQAEQAGKLSGVMKRLVQELLRPRLPWRSVLAHYLTGLARDDYSYTRPSTRRGNPAIFPSLKSQQLHAVVALDVSGSVSDKELHEYLSEINAIKGQIRAEITLIACDADIIQGFPKTFQPWEDITLSAELQGGGTTDFRPVFDWINQQDRVPDVLIYFTDAQGIFPNTAPSYSVLWLVKGNSDVPWGVRVGWS